MQGCFNIGKPINVMHPIDRTKDIEHSNVFFFSPWFSIPCLAIHWNTTAVSASMICELNSSLSFQAECWMYNICLQDVRTCLTPLHSPGHIMHKENLKCLSLGLTYYTEWSQKFQSVRKHEWEGMEIRLELDFGTAIFISRIFAYF